MQWIWRRMAPVLLFSLCLSILLPGCTTAPLRGRGAHEMMAAFRSGYGATGVIYAPDVAEGQPGYCDGSFFAVTYGCDSTGIRDYAVLLTGRSDRVGECAVFLCDSAYGALAVVEMCQRRLELLVSFSAALDVRPAREGFVLRQGEVVVMCAMGDAARARRLLRQLL